MNAHISYVFKNVFNCITLLFSSPVPALLPSEASHYVVPDGGTLCLFQEVFEHPSLMGVIVTQTAANTVCYMYMSIKRCAVQHY